MLCIYIKNSLLCKLCQILSLEEGLHSYFKSLSFRQTRTYPRMSTEQVSNLLKFHYEFNRKLHLLHLLIPDLVQTNLENPEFNQTIIYDS